MTSERPERFRPEREPERAAGLRRCAERKLHAERGRIGIELCRREKNNGAVNVRNDPADAELVRLPAKVYGIVHESQRCCVGRGVHIAQEKLPW